MTTYHRKLDEQRAAKTQAAIARAGAKAKGKAAGVLCFFRSGDPAMIPEGVTLADTKAAAELIREQDYAEAWNPLRLPGLRAVVSALGAPSIPSALEYIAGKRAGAGWTRNDASGILSRLGLTVTAV
jgi:hypothetical protein